RGRPRLLRVQHRHILARDARPSVRRRYDSALRRRQPRRCVAAPPAVARAGAGRLPGRAGHSAAAIAALSRCGRAGARTDGVRGASEAHGAASRSAEPGQCARAVRRAERNVSRSRVRVGPACPNGGAALARGVAGAPGSRGRATRRRGRLRDVRLGTEPAIADLPSGAPRPQLRVGAPEHRAVRVRAVDAVRRRRIEAAGAERMQDAGGRSHRDHGSPARPHSQPAARHSARGARQQLWEGACVLRDVDEGCADRPVGRDRGGRGARGGAMVVVTTPTADAVDASVIVCTRNRSGAMTLLLESLQRLEVPPGVRGELIVVDNGSSDDTPATLASFETLLPMQIVREPMPGLARARNAGLAAARGQVLLCTDDDCVPDSKWLAAVYEEFRRAPTLGMLGGRVELYDARDRPTTTRTSRERRRITALFELDDIIGCNMSFRRSAFEAIGPFDVALGGGTGARAGE